MSKNIVLCSDGTGQAGGQGFVSNVWRIFKAVDRNLPEEQVAFHADGVGTDNNKFLRTIGGAFGYGLSEDICSLYATLVRSYSDSDNIFLFGFSRGAFTVRSLAGMIDHIGIMRAESFHSEQEIISTIKKAYIAYRKNKPFEEFDKHPNKNIKFVGVWDTVDAIGVPFDGLRRLIYLIAKLKLTPHKDELNSSIKNAYHAISIDDERYTFHPRIWKEKDFSGNVEQVWFAGVHSNVGGGYPKDSLSFISLDWMMKKAHDCGLKFVVSKWALFTSENKFSDYQEQADRNGRIYDSRAGFAIYYRYRPRKVQKLWASENPTSPAKIHESVLMRIKQGYTSYAPTALPENFDSVCTWSHDIGKVSFKLNLDKAWGCIRKRVLLYRALIASTIIFILAGFLMHSDSNAPCEGSQPCSSILTFLKDSLPNFMSGWLNNIAANPLVLGTLLVTFLILYILHVYYKKETKRYADEAWDEVSFKQ